MTDAATIVAVSIRNFKEGSVKPFKAKVEGKLFHGLLVKKNGKFYAYRNLCKHLPVTLDLLDGNFVNHEETLIQCHMHGALYELETGYCIEGPCQGANLDCLEIKVEEKRVVITVPQD